MIWDWIAEKSTGLMAFLVALAFICVAFFYYQFRFVCICVALIAIVYGCKQMKKHDTPFERHEREMKRKQL